MFSPVIIKRDLNAAETRQKPQAHLQQGAPRGKQPAEGGRRGVHGARPAGRPRDRLADVSRPQASCRCLTAYDGQNLYTHYKTWLHRGQPVGGPEERDSILAVFALI